MKVARVVLALALASLGWSLFAHDDDGPLQSFVFRYGGETRMRTINESVNADDLPSGNYLWFRWNGDAYVIEDARTLARMNAAYAPVRDAKSAVRELKDKRREVKDRDRELRNERRTLERQLRTASRRDEPVTAVEQQLREIDRRREALERDIQALSSDIARRQEGADERRAQADRQWLQIIEEAMRTGVAKRN